MNRLPLGTRSLLFGVHQVTLHPWFVLAAWVRLYGWPWHPAIWLSFVVHDWGYLGAQSMDGPEDGELHPRLGARIVGAIFGQRWHDFVLYHSRFLAKRDRQPYSRLCVADKLAIAMTPAWLYLPLARLSGEVQEYMATYGTRTVSGKPKGVRFGPGDERLWFAHLQAYMLEWALEHRDLKPDTWTNREPVGTTGVYQ